MNEIRKVGREISAPRNKKAYDLEERTAKFGELAVQFCKTVRHDTVTRPIISQLVCSATSIGANYMEANGASSRKDFTNKIFTCKKEAQETKHWLRMIATATPEVRPAARALWKEAQELTLIFGRIVASARSMP